MQLQLPIFQKKCLKKINNSRSKIGKLHAAYEFMNFFTTFSTNIHKCSIKEKINKYFSPMYIFIKIFYCLNKNKIYRQSLQINCCVTVDLHIDYLYIDTIN